MSQIKTIVRSIMKHGVLHSNRAVAHFKKRGYTFDQTLLVERVRRINKNPQKHGIPEGFIIGSQPMVVDGRVERIYGLALQKLYKSLDARKPEVIAGLQKYATIK
jgi:hypothetical protein